MRVAAAAMVALLLLAMAPAPHHNEPSVQLIPPLIVHAPGYVPPPVIASRDFTRPLLSWSPSKPFTTFAGQDATPAAPQEAARPSRSAATSTPTSTVILDPSQPTTRGPAEVGEAEAGPRTWAPWLRIAACESSGHWADNTGNGYYGGLQEDMNFWHSYGDQRYARPDLAPIAAQIAAATEARDGGRGYKPWPICGARA